MRKIWLVLLFAAGLLAGVFGGIQYARGQGPSGPDGVIINSETQGENRREISAPAAAGPMQPEAPTIGFIDSPTATCYQPDIAQDVCYINWYYLSVDASPNYMISMTISLNDYGRVSQYSGFFQTSMYAPYNMHGQGFKVPCGAPGASGLPTYGKAYAYTIRAKDSSNLSSANYGTVYCPPRKP